VVSLPSYHYAADRYQGLMDDCAVGEHPLSSVSRYVTSLPGVLGFVLGIFGERVLGPSSPNRRGNSDETHLEKLCRR
jgi:hypothetical protein